MLTNLSTDRAVIHVTPRKADLLIEVENYSYPHHEYNRVSSCLLLIPEEQCDYCFKEQAHAKKMTARKSRKLATPAKLNAPISKTTSERVKLTLQDQHLKCKQLEDQLVQIKEKLKKFLSL